MIETVLVIIILALVSLFVLAPLRRGSRAVDKFADASKERLVELQLAKQTKLAEIREAEMDYRSHKLSDGDYQAIDGELRGETAAIIAELDQLKLDKDLPVGSGTETAEGA